MLKKAIFFFTFLSSLFIINYSLLIDAAHADEAFAVDANVTYKVKESGKTQVTHNITLENLFSTLYATTYTLSLENINVQNVSATDENGLPIKVDAEQVNSKLNFKLTFANPVVGRGSKRKFNISYENGGFATKTGEVWEISIPRLSEQSNFRNYNINFLVPDSFGQEAYISPQPISSTNANGYKNYVFSKESISATGVTAGFGQFQVFSFNLSYHLENPLSINSQTEIALPPDTAFQKVYFSKVDPKPYNVKIDEDGNWLAVYKLSPRQRIDVNVVGSVQIFASYRHFPSPSKEILAENLKPTNYWQSDSEQIKLLAENLKTPQAIYNFVSTKLKYDTARVQPNIQRVGALDALQNSSNAICMEFTDLFIAIARAAGIPAREINGYAYTENKELQPLSLVNDVLHAWPEYYDKEKNVWIPVDPTWGSTSGVDYFNKLDLRHFAFVIHGTRDTQPYPPGSYKLGSNPQKDVFVSFGILPDTRIGVPQISVITERNIPFFDALYTIKIFNPGPSSIDNLYPAVYFDGKENSRQYIQLLPPLAFYSYQIKVPFSLLGKDTPDSIRIVADGSSIDFSTNKIQVVTNSLLIVFALLIIVVIVVLVRLKKINLSKITATISRIYAKISGKSPKNTNSI